jgi:hypothetical protein
MSPRVPRDGVRFRGPVHRGSPGIQGCPGGARLAKRQASHEFRARRMMCHGEPLFSSDVLSSDV